MQTICRFMALFNDFFVAISLLDGNDSCKRWFSLKLIEKRQLVN